MDLRGGLDPCDAAEFPIQAEMPEAVREFLEYRRDYEGRDIDPEVNAIKLGR